MLTEDFKDNDKFFCQIIVEYEDKSTPGVVSKILNEVEVKAIVM